MEKTKLLEINKYLGILIWMSIQSNSNYLKNWNISDPLHKTKYNNFIN